MRRLRRTEFQPGQAIPVLALTLLLLIAFAGLAIDGALAFAWRRNVMNSADGAALIATRALIVDRGSITGAAVTGAVRTYLQAELDVAEPDFELTYVNGAGQSIGPVGTGPAPSEARGVQVVVRHTFDTYLMGIMGQPTLTVRGVSAARFGNGGTLIGDLIAPMGLLPEAAEFFRSNPTGALVDLSGRIEERNDRIITDFYKGLYPYLTRYQDHPDWVDPDTFVKRWQVRAVALRMGSATPPSLGPGASCPATPADTLKSWWCFGAHQAVNTRIAGDGDQVALAMDLIGVEPYASSLNATLLSGGFLNVRLGQVIIVPVLAEASDSDQWSGANPVYVIEYFMALRLSDIDYADGTITVDYLPRYLTNGGLMGSNNNVERGDPCEVCVVNLVRE
ncbi:pilus assembly protein TadG-related protein [Roseiflexus sp.]